MPSSLESASLVQGVATRQTFTLALELLVRYALTTVGAESRSARLLELYPQRLQEVAADRARTLEISAASAAVFFIFVVSRHAIEAIGFWSRLLSTNSKALYRDHDAMLSIDNVLLKHYAHDPISGYLNMQNKAAIRRYADEIRNAIGGGSRAAPANLSW